MPVTEIRTPTAAYAAHVDGGLLQSAGQIVRSLAQGGCTAVVTDENAGPLYAEPLCASLRDAGFEPHVLTLPAGEQIKSLAELARVYDFFTQCRLSRGDTVFALGGGVIGDLSGFAAGTYLRGVPYIQCPTTLLSMVDSSVGGKTGIDLPGGKNLAGVFYHPKAVIADTDTLTSLPPRQIACGMAEIIKHACIRDAGLLSRLDLPYGELVLRNIEIKRDVVQQDEFESGLREILNFGHTFGHAAEALGGYRRYTHGEAVAVGMVLAAKIGIRLGVTPPELLAPLADALATHGLPTEADYGAQELMRYAAADKKMKNDGLTLVLLCGPGCCIRRTVPLCELSRILREIL